MYVVRRTTEACLYYKLTYEPSAKVSYNAVKGRFSNKREAGNVCKKSQSFSFILEN